MIPDEQQIVAFFNGTCSGPDLDRSWRDAFKVERDGAGQPTSRRLYSTPPAEEFWVEPWHCVALIDAVMAGEVSLETLDAVCFAVEASDAFGWDTEKPEGERVAEGLFLLGTPECNYPLTRTVLEKVRLYLLTGRNLLGPGDLKAREAPAGARRGVKDVWKRPDA